MLALAPGYKFQWEAAQESWVLLYPEGMVQLNPSAGEILQRCDGSRDAAAIVADLERAFPAADVADDVREFLEVARGNGWIIERD